MTVRSIVRKAPAVRLRKLPISAAIITAVIIANPAPTIADRHCFPASDSYQMARHIVLDESLSPATRVQRAGEEIENAAAESEGCSCDAIRAVFLNLSTSLNASGLSDASVRASVLAAESKVKAALEICHD